MKLHDLFYSVSFSVIFLAVSILPEVALSGQVCLQNGDCLHGKIVEQTDTIVTIKHPNLGNLTIPLSEIVNITTQSPPEKTSQIVVQTNSKDTEEEKPQWLHRVFLGFSGEEGNDVSFKVRTGFSSKYEDDHDRWDISGRYIYESEDREKDDSKGNLNFSKDWLKPETPWFLYLAGRYEYDSFKYWKHRVALFVGPGYEFLKTDTFSLRGRIGIGGSRTWGIDDEEYPEGALGIETEWKPNDLHEVSVFARIFPNLSDIDEYRTLAKAEWRVKFDAKRGLNILSGIEHEYESTINPNESDDRHYDLLYFWGLEMEF